MHIPDGYLSPATCAGLYLTAAPFWYIALHRVKRVFHSSFLPLISVFAAFSFVVMMFNLPLPGGTTGHAIGVGVAAVVLGPWASILAISTALVIQALFFGDGGITAIGANCFNMAIVGSLVAYACYRVLARGARLGSERRVLASAVAGYAAINVAALCAAIEFGIQPALFHDAAGTPLYCPYPLSISIPAMMIGHLTFAGLAELMITAGVVAYLQRADPSLLRRTASDAPDRDQPTAELSHALLSPRRTLRRLWLALSVLLVLTPLGILAVGSAWGEWSAQDFVNPATRQEIAAASAHHLPPAQPPRGLARLSAFWNAPLARYAPSFVRSASLGYLLSAVLGVTLVALCLSLLRWLLRLRSAPSSGFVERTVRGFIVAADYSLFAEELARSRGFLQRLEARVKLVAVASLVLAAMAVRSLPVLLSLFVLSLVAALCSRVPLRVLLKRVWLPTLAFSGLIILPALFLTPGSVVYRLPFVPWPVTAQGLRTCCLLLLRVETAATLVALLVVTTAWARVLHALRFFRVPVTGVVILGMTYRYAFLLLKTAREMLESRQSRLVGTLVGRERRRLAAASVGVLLSKSLSLSTEVESAMRSRGFVGDVYLIDEPAIGWRDALQLVLIVMLALSAVLLGK